MRVQRPQGWEPSRGDMWLLPFRISVGVGPRKWRHGVAEDDVGVVEDLLHLHGPVGAPANVISCNRKAAGSLCKARGRCPGVSDLLESAILQRALTTQALPEPASKSLPGTCKHTVADRYGYLTAFMG